MPKYFVGKWNAIQEPFCGRGNCKWNLVRKFVCPEIFETIWMQSQPCNWMCLPLGLLLVVMLDRLACIAPISKGVVLLFCPLKLVILWPMPLLVYYPTSMQCGCVPGQQNALGQSTGEGGPAFLDLSWKLTFWIFEWYHLILYML